MKVKLNAIFLVPVLLAVFLTGMVVQRFYGLGNLIALSSIAPSEPLPQIDHYEVDVFLLLGQSNMEGSGSLEAYVKPPTEIASRIFALDENYILTAATEPLKPSGVGPCVSFAAEYLANVEDPRRAVILVLGARGGTNIQQWSPDRVERTLYAQAMKRALAASLYGDIKGVLFFQGENDAEGDVDDRAEDWDLYFTDLVSAWRRDFRSPSLPIVFAQIGKGASVPWQKVKDSQARVAIPGVSMIKTDDLAYQEDCHFTTQSYQEIGKRFANALLRLSVETHEKAHSSD